MSTRNRRGVDTLMSRNSGGGVIEWVIRKWSLMRRGTVMSEQFAAGYRAGHTAGLRMGREDARHGRVSEAPVWQVASERQAS